MNQTSTKPKLLIVDDQPRNIFALEKVLQPLEVEILQATSGNQALSLTLKHTLFLAIVDVQMPEMDGYELVALLRGNPKTNRIPVIFISAIYSDNYHHLKGYDAGAVDFLSKPVVPEILLSKVQVFLDLYQQHHQLEAVVEQLNNRNETLQQEIEQRLQIEATLRQTNQTLATRAAQLEITSQVGRQITSILDLDELLTVVVKLIQAKFDYYFVGIWLLTEREEAGAFIKEKVILQAGASQNETETLPVGLTFEVATHQSLISRVCREEQPYVVADVRVDATCATLDGLPRTRAKLVLPLHIGHQMIGVLDIRADQVARFSSEDQLVLQSLADQIAIAIRNAQLYEMKELHQIEAAKARYLADLNASKDKFFSIVAHDLRGPFMPLLGNVELLIEMADILPPAEIREISLGVYRSGKRMLNLLENLLQWSRLQMGRMEYQPELLNLQQVTQKTVDLLAATAEAKDITLSNQVTEQLDVYADNHMLNTIIRNLTSNALKFTPIGGQVVISARQLEEPFVELSIMDSGVGIPAEDIAKLFAVEIPHSTTGTAQETGTGLGLIMCKEMVELNGGQIEVDSQLQQGTTVKLTIPVRGHTYDG